MDIMKLFKDYLEENYNLEGERNTIKAYYSDVNQFINFFKDHFGEQIVDFSNAHIIEYRKYLLDEMSLKFSSINRKMAAISIYENFLIDKNIRKSGVKIIKKRDFYKIDRPYITSDMLPKETIKKVRLKAGINSKRDYAMFVILDEGGLRVSELIKLELERDIDFDMYQIRILGKGQKIRSIFIDKIMYDALIDYLPEREKLLNGRVNKYLFVSNKSANTNKPIGRTSINNILNKYCNEIQHKKIKPHIFRHDCATKKYEDGYTDIMIKKQLGQTSNVTDIYTHPGNEKYRKLT